MKKKYNVTHLEISSWDGLSFGATHDYGHLWNGNERVQVEKKLTQAEADKLNEKDGTNTYRQDSTTERFEAEEDIIRFSVKVYKHRFPESNMLVLGSPVSYEPKVILDYPVGFDATKALNIFLEAEKLGFYQNPKNDLKMAMLMKEYDSLFE
jgi:hypothetical protein